jgi:hypothetical protein
MSLHSDSENKWYKTDNCRVWVVIFIQLVHRTPGVTKNYETEFMKVLKQAVEELSVIVK